MKKIYTLLFFASALAAGNSATGQTVGFALYNSDSVGCANQAYITLDMGPSGESAGVVNVSWGDGSSDTYPYTAAPSQTQYLSLDHGYTLAGTYTATVDVYSGTAGATVGSQSVVFLAQDAANCGLVYISTYQSSPNIGFYDVPYDFTGADGIVTTVTPTQYYYQGLNIANAPYTVSINDAWLAANGLAQVNPDNIITSFDPSGGANPFQMSFEVTCTAPAPGPDFVAGYGFATAFIASLQTGTVYLYNCNYACSDVSDAQVTLTFDPILTPVTTGLINPVTGPGTLTFDLPALGDCEQTQIQFTFPGSTPAGTLFDFTSTISSISEMETTTTNNTNTFSCFVWNSYDPNNKIVNKPANIDPAVAETLQYVINFQNEGNFAAMDVVVQDTIAANLDLSTFQLLGAKHGVATSVDPATRVVTFSFDGINLDYADNNEEASKGFVVYSIQENAGLPVNSEIENTAYIYFDFNPAIVTNTTYNINALSLGLDETAADHISMFPNPAASVVRFQGADVTSAQIYDLTGKLVGGSDTMLSNELSVAGLSNGIYHVVIATAKGVQSQKLVIRK